MERKKWFMILAVLCGLCLLVTGCSRRAGERSEQESQPESPQEEIVAEAPVSSPESSQPGEEESQEEKEEESRQEVFLAEEDYGQLPRNQFEGASGRVYSLEDRQEAGYFDMGATETVAGSVDDLAWWYEQLYEADAVVETLHIAAMVEESWDLTPEQVNGIMQILKSVQMETMDELGNPSSGGLTQVAALNGEGKVQWLIGISSDWFTVYREGRLCVFDSSGVWDQLGRIDEILSR